MEVGTLLIQHRERAMLSQKQVAELLGIAQSTYCDWESDRTSFKVAYLPKLAEVFKVEITDLLPSVPNYRIVHNANNCGSSVNAFQVGNVATVDHRDALIATQSRLITALEEQIAALKQKLGM